MKKGRKRVSNSAAFDDDLYRQAVARDQQLERNKHTRRSQHWLLLERWVNEHGWRHGAEIGVQRGWTTFHLLDHCPGLHMTMVDQWAYVPDTGEDGWADYAHMDPEYCARRVKERAAGYGERARIIHLPSTVAAKQVDDESLDFVFLDDDHTERGCLESIEAWLPKVKHFGWLIGHDANWPTVQAALNKRLPGWKEYEHFCWALPKAGL